VSAHCAAQSSGGGDAALVSQWRSAGTHTLRRRSLSLLLDDGPDGEPQLQPQQQPPPQRLPPFAHSGSIGDCERLHQQGVAPRAHDKECARLDGSTSALESGAPCTSPTAELPRAHAVAAAAGADQLLGAAQVATLQQPPSCTQPLRGGHARAPGAPATPAATPTKRVVDGAVHVVNLAALAFPG